MLRRRYPSQIVAGLLYLGDWANAEDVERLDELKVKRWGGVGTGVTKQEGS